MRYFTNSEFQTFKDCRRKWYLAYYRNLRLRYRRLVGAAPLGTQVHSSLAAFYVPEGVEPVDPREALELVIARDQASIIEAYADRPDEVPGELAELAKQSDMARAMIEGYVQWIEETGVDSEFEVIGTEEAVEYQFAEGMSLAGRLDVRIRMLRDRAIRFIDHKTCQSFIDLERTLPQSEQMQKYLVLNRAVADPEERVTGALYNMLRKVKRTGNAKPPFYQRAEVAYNGHQVEAIWQRMMGEVADILDVQRKLDAGQPHNLVAYPRPNSDCHWKCEFYPVCPMFDDGSRAEDMLAAVYVVGDPLDRYPELTGGTPVDG